MDALELDYVRASAPTRRARYVLALVAAAFAIDAGLHYRTLASDVAAREARAAAARVQQPVPSVATVPQEELAYARDTLLRLSTPWDGLFQALEASQTDRVALLSVEPDALQRTVTITGEAKDYLAALSYMASLAEQKNLARVHLVRHEPQRSAPQRPVAFTVSAAWRDAK